MQYSNACCAAQLTLCCHVAGPKLGKWIVLPPQLIVMIGLGITYSVTGGSSLHNFYKIVCHKNDMGECKAFGLSAWIVVFSAIHLFLIQVNAAAFGSSCTGQSAFSIKCLMYLTRLNVVAFTHSDALQEHPIVQLPTFCCTCQIASNNAMLQHCTHP